jgi:protein-S-isoprenylcysteine O-methyltransferase
MIFFIAAGKMQYVTRGAAMAAYATSITAETLMTSVRIIWLILCLFWIISEIRLARTSSPNQPTVMHSELQSQRWLWLSVLGSLIFALGFKQLAWLPLPIHYLPRQLLAIVLFSGGLGLRYWAVSHLGRFFTTHVTIQQQHRLITSGPYRLIRHPAYTGLLLALAAAGIAMGDLLALLFLTLPTFYTFSLRISIEERMLQQKFASLYQDYCKTSWRLLPWLY